MFCQTINSDCQSSPVMSDVDNIFVTGGKLCYMEPLLYHTDPGHECGEELRLSGQFIRYGCSDQTIRNRIFYPGPFLDYHCFHQRLWIQCLKNLSAHRNNLKEEGQIKYILGQFLFAGHLYTYM